MDAYHAEGTVVVAKVVEIYLAEGLAEMHDSWEGVPDAVLSRNLVCRQQG